MSLVKTDQKIVDHLKIVTVPQSPITICLKVCFGMLHIHPSQPKDVISPAYPGSTPRSPPGGTLLDRPTEEVPLVIIPSQLPPVDTEEHGLYPKYLDSTPCLCGWAQLNPATNHSSTSWQSLLHETTKPRHLPELKLNQTLCAPWLCLQFCS